MTPRFNLPRFTATISKIKKSNRFEQVQIEAASFSIITTFLNLGVAITFEQVLYTNSFPSVIITF